MPTLNETKRGRPRKAATSAAVVPLQPAQPPATPEGLSDAGAAVWRDVWGAAVLDGVLSAELDAPAVERYCSLLDERTRWAAQLDQHGPLLERPVQSARGELLGMELYANPAVKELRSIDRALDQLSDRLAGSPAARARLGLVLNSARQNQANAERIISAKFANSSDAT
jgi:P27 family predicted phage terminase small subunit